MKIKLSFKLIITTILILLQYSVSAGDKDKVYFTNGFKIGEVTQNSVVILTRLCKAEFPVPIQHKQKEAPFCSPIDFDNDMEVSKMDGHVAGTFGRVRITLISEKDTLKGDWTHVSSYEDYTFKQQIGGLLPNTKYDVLIEGRKNFKSPKTSIKGSFTTSPMDHQIVPVTFTSTSCQYFWDYDHPERGFNTYDAMAKLNPQFHCQTGDFVYYDKPGPMSYNIELARHKWGAINGWPSIRDFYANVPLYLEKDDHDMLKDDATPKIKPLGEFTFYDGLKVWRENAPLYGTPYRTFRWGQDLQIWLIEGREFRSENKSPDSPEKTILGKEQIAWLKETVKNSDATFKVLLSPTPIVGPDRVKGKTDNHANASFKTEGEWLRKFLGENTIYVVNGDRHWQYVSEDQETGLLEFSQGATSDNHAQGWKQEDVRPEHKFLRVKGGFVAVNVFRENNIPTIEFVHFDCKGNEVNKEVIKYKSL
ncbi:alkaline phosphatase D family protein [Flammeovirga yaeyamensis]|uniref:Alkaline phosphatase D family protein n=1 Tax=Flammeovirga yaeyamensis TaxID=367791 RepID=A0AAX1N2T1_9BACT|nr:alkaline phosphatase D family protein [Flammeovirga yaeyamensis]MBB3700760.1 alkaline phosphatase D [Flammeovirga yaeyamensis]NMF37884.1 alkaline phosphatase [Flammeovirga yaeyamensis]QWG01755.1 alkaline phosphatase D family protein [Flammeovirga yaeyamensis]